MSHSIVRVPLCRCSVWSNEQLPGPRGVPEIERVTPPGYRFSALIAWNCCIALRRGTRSRFGSPQIKSEVLIKLVCWSLLSMRGSTAPVLAAACSDQLRGAKGHAFGFVYATSPLSVAFPEIVNILQKRTGIQQWVGTVGHGVCA